jgi:hypothetical protein
LAIIYAREYETYNEARATESEREGEVVKRKKPIRGRARIKKLTDDQIVDALVLCGVRGLDYEDPWDGSSFQWITRKLTGIGVNDDLDDEEDAEAELAERLRAMPDRVYDPDGDTFFVTPQEWARRLVGKTVEEMTAILAGGGGTA